MSKAYRAWANIGGAGLRLNVISKYLATFSLVIAGFIDFCIERMLGFGFLYTFT